MLDTLQEYEIDDSKLTEWIPWGGLVQPSVVRNKDNSYMGFFTYDWDQDAPLQSIELPLFKGVSLWVETSSYLDGKPVLTVCWNPFFGMNKKILNVMEGDKPFADYRNADHYFLKILSAYEKELSKLFNIKRLINEDVLSFLASTISMKEEHKAMPDVPLYLDARLSTLSTSFVNLPDGIELGGNSVAVFSLPAFGHYDKLQNLLFWSLGGMNYRFSRRMLCMTRSYAEKVLNKYTSSWCSDRSGVKDAIKKGLLFELNGYYTNSLFLFENDEDKLDISISNTKKILETIQVPYIEETKNYKDVWYGSLPGIFRANLVPPIQGTSVVQFMAIGNLLLDNEEGEENSADVQA